MPSKMVTVEKNGKPRTILLTPACRILVARWICERPLNAPTTPSPYLFPSQARPDTPVSVSYMWRLCRSVFRRANLHGAHVHPHTFRHTLIHLMYLGGTTFENIAKFIGHASANVTSAVYGRLRQMEVVGSIQGVPFLTNAEAQEESQAWKEIIQLVAYSFYYSWQSICGWSFACRPMESLARRMGGSF